MSTLTSTELMTEMYISSLRYCICGSQVKQDKEHDSCIVSGITRKIFTDVDGWKAYCLENGRRIASYYRRETTFPEHVNNMRNR